MQRRGLAPAVAASANVMVVYITGVDPLVPETLG